ncbi:hypothetical protein BaRGS_00004214 [Batillaria attramentaria]|uniref:Uncharacterized protein n=1 Tax=Batillaria attramentaria TaxID=370345 RepID=A0ABD0LZ29_9CAEN
MLSCCPIGTRRPFKSACMMRFSPPVHTGAPVTVEEFNHHTMKGGGGGAFFRLGGCQRRMKSVGNKAKRKAIGSASSHTQVFSGRSWVTFGCDYSREQLSVNLVEDGQ